jgi:hypothetical protein
LLWVVATGAICLRPSVALMHRVVLIVAFLVLA